jgi:hypothetical protein
LQLRVEERKSIREKWIRLRKIWILDSQKNTISNRNFQGLIKFKKDKMLKELTSSVRLILCCSTEILSNLNDGKAEEKGWVIERGRRKYVCFLRFSEEMTASLNRDFERLEEFFVLDHEERKKVKDREISKIGGHLR